MIDSKINCIGSNSDSGSMVCMYVCMKKYICKHLCLFVRSHVCIYLCMHVCMHVCMYVCLFDCLNVGRPLCMRVNVHPSIYVCTYMRECSLHTYAHVCSLITEKAVHKPNISEPYANMCKVLPMGIQAQAPAESRNKDKPECRAAGWWNLRSF
jgi:hypothetical protein